MTIITFNNLTKADGSALIDQDGTIIQASVFGPVDVPQSKVNYEEATVEILYRPKINIAPTSPAFDSIREIEKLIRSVFQEVILTRLHPRTSIIILIQEIHNTGNILNASINAVCCALIDAGLPMNCPVVSVFVEQDGDKFDFVFDNKLDLITILTRNCVDVDNLKKAIETGQSKAKEGFEKLREQLRELLVPHES